LLSREREIPIVAETRPLFLGQREMVPNDGFGSFVVNRQSLCEVLKNTGRCRLRAGNAAMNSEPGARLY